MFWGDYKSDLKDFEELVREEAPMLPDGPIKVVVAIVVMFSIVLWPYFPAMSTYDFMKEKFGKGNRD